MSGGKEWADVFLEASATRQDIERSALFFVPRFFSVAEDEELTVNALAGVSARMKKKRPGIIAGRAALTRVHHGEMPVSYRAAVGSINVINDLLAEGARFSRRDIVACIFRLRDGPDIRDALGEDLPDFAAETGLAAEVIQAAFMRYRLPYVDAHKIWAQLIKYKKKNPKRLSDIGSITEEESDLIVADNRSEFPPSILQVANRNSESGANEATYVYNRANVLAAPLTGHRWSLE